MIKTFMKEMGLYFRVLASAATAPWNGEISPVGRLYAIKISPDGNKTDLGLVCTKMVTTAGVNYLVDGLVSGFKFTPTIYSVLFTSLRTIRRFLGRR